MPRQPRNKTQDIVVLYTVQHLTMEEIGKIIGMSRTGICKRLKTAGITPDLGEWVRTDCDYCGSIIRVTRKRWRRNEKNYCNNECYYAYLENPSYKPWRQGQRLARAIVAQYFDLQLDHVVHHKDGDSRNNDRSNLAVYASQEEHMRGHRSNYSSLLWDGSSI